MIQERTMQDLWAAVEELRQRVEELENGGQSAPAPVPPDYIASAKSNRKTFHRRGCRFTGRFVNLAGGFQEFESRDTAVAAGLTPCKSCGA